MKVTLILILLGWLGAEAMPVDRRDHSHEQCLCSKKTVDERLVQQAVPPLSKVCQQKKQLIVSTCKEGSIELLIL